MKLILLLTLFLFISCASTPEITPPKPVESEQTIKFGKKVILWSTYYFTPMVGTSNTGYPLRDKANNKLTPNLSLDNWCLIGLQGTGALDGVTYTYQKSTSEHRVPCERSFLKNASFARATGRIKYYRDKHKYGSGNKNNALTPYKSIACDQSIYKFGQKFYIPQAKGAILPDGTIHDGIFSCDDVGGAIKGNHIDTFLGFVDLRNQDFSKRYAIAYRQMPKQMQEYIKSTKEGTFTAYLVD